jgi:hypothetical protein
MAKLRRTPPCQTMPIAAKMPIQVRRRIRNLIPNNATCARATQ